MASDHRTPRREVAGVQGSSARRIDEGSFHSDGRARAVDPYRRFVRAEDSHWREAMARLSALRDEASAFRRDLAASFTAPA
jgi:hypothetical protein